MGTGISVLAHVPDVLHDIKEDGGAPAPDYTADQCLTAGEESEIILEASHLSEGDTLRIFSFIDAAGYDVDSREGVLRFLQGILQDDSLVAFCQRLLVPKEERAQTSRTTPQNDGEVDGQRIVSSLWNFLTMDHTRLMAFLFSIYESKADEFSVGLTAPELEAMLGDLHGASDLNAIETSSAKLRELLAASEGEGKGGRLYWQDFSAVLRDDKVFLKPLYDSQTKLRAHLLGEEFWQRRACVRTSVLGGAVIIPPHEPQAAELQKGDPASSSRRRSAAAASRRPSVVDVVAAAAADGGAEGATVRRRSSAAPLSNRTKSTIFGRRSSRRASQAAAAAAAAGTPSRRGSCTIAPLVPGSSCSENSLPGPQPRRRSIVFATSEDSRGNTGRDVGTATDNNIDGSGGGGGGGDGGGGGSCSGGGDISGGIGHGHGGLHGSRRRSGSAHCHDNSGGHDNGGGGGGSGSDGGGSSSRGGKRNNNQFKQREGKIFKLHDMHEHHCHRLVLLS
ncbi:hypothetical protein JKP88DRAFT_248383 [Tribonema minus]|uniref:Uncharacterized protein n=1 Tax=Tribonema minus TaxID=303371 RepID=A0A835YP54_9STRA|nr:hypothetical protein JKP88DRAFT_248383 [Tribonema minus]